MMAEDMNVYVDKVYYYADEYASGLKDPNSIIGNAGLFTGMVKYIYQNCFKPPFKQPTNMGCIFDLKNDDDLEKINYFWYIFTDLSYKYNVKPSIIRFSFFIGISCDTLNDIKAGINKANIKAVPFVRKWYKECEQSLIDGATDKNSVGSIFILKSNYGYVETPQKILIAPGTDPELLKTDIASRHSLNGDKMPELPDDLT